MADESNADESLRTSEPDFYRYQVSTTTGSYTGVAVVRIPGDGSTTSHTVIGIDPRHNLLLPDAG